jgi:hypothetical protein
MDNMGWFIFAMWFLIGFIGCLATVEEGPTKAFALLLFWPIIIVCLGFKGLLEFLMET